MLISVIIPVFNTERYVENAIQSIQNQTYKNLEIIIINDGSTDSTQKILIALSKNDDRIRLYSRENRGLVSTLNEALSLCNGDFIMRMDADDISLKNRAEIQINYLIANPNCDIVGGQGIAINMSGTMTGIVLKPIGSKIINSHIIKNSPLIHSSVMIRRQAIGENFYRQNDWPAEDYGAWIRLNNGSNIANINRFLVKYRRNKNGISHLNSEMQNLKKYELKKQYLLNSFLNFKTTQEKIFIVYNKNFRGMLRLWSNNKSYLNLMYMTINFLIEKLKSPSLNDKKKIHGNFYD